VDTCIDSFGLPTDIPVVGDWTGTGTAKLGVYRRVSGTWIRTAMELGMVVGWIPV
jgi:hypothetical protein